MKKRARRIHYKALYIDMQHSRNCLNELLQDRLEERTQMRAELQQVPAWIRQIFAWWARLKQWKWF